MQQYKGNERDGILKMLIESIRKDLIAIYSDLTTLLDRFIMPKADELESKVFY